MGGLIIARHDDLKNELTRVCSQANSCSAISNKTYIQYSQGIRASNNNRTSPATCHLSPFTTRQEATSLNFWETSLSMVSGSTKWIPSLMFKPLTQMPNLIATGALQPIFKHRKRGKEE
eukprot:9032073-Ditylum_brightwellii.AAC.1